MLHREQGDLVAREELVSRFLPLARQLARRYSRSNESLEDLVQVASVGLVKAVDRFDHTRGTPFARYAVQSEIAARVGVSQMHVSRLIRRALQRLQVVAEAA